MLEISAYPILANVIQKEKNSTWCTIRENLDGAAMGEHLEGSLADIGQLYGERNGSTATHRARPSQHYKHGP